MVKCNWVVIIMELNEKEINEIVENIRKDYFYFSEIPDEIKIKYQQILNYKHEQTLWRLSWNNNGMMLSVKGEDRKPLIFWNVKGRYTKMDLIGE